MEKLYTMEEAKKLLRAHKRTIQRRKPRNPEKVEIFCEMAEAAVEEGVIFKGNKIVEILPWDD